MIHVQITVMQVYEPGEVAGEVRRGTREELQGLAVLAPTLLYTVEARTTGGDAAADLLAMAERAIRPERIRG